MPPKRKAAVLGEDASAAEKHQKPNSPHPSSEIVELPILDISALTMTSLSLVDSDSNPVPFKLKDNYLVAQLSGEMVEKELFFLHMDKDIIVPVQPGMKKLSYEEMVQKSNKDCIDDSHHENEMQIQWSGDHLFKYPHSSHDLGLSLANMDKWQERIDERGKHSSDVHHCLKHIAKWYEKIRHAYDDMKADTIGHRRDFKHAMRANSPNVNLKMPIDHGKQAYCPTCDKFVSQYCLVNEEHPHHTCCYCHVCIFKYNRLKDWLRAQLETFDDHPEILELLEVDTLFPTLTSGEEESD